MEDEKDFLSYVVNEHIDDDYGAGHFIDVLAAAILVQPRASSNNWNVAGGGNRNISI